MPLLLEVQHLTKRYKRFLALNDLCMKVYEGEVYGLLGPNGAGKTTLLSTLFGLLIPDGGEIYLLGRAVQPGRPETLHGLEGFVDTPAFYPHLSAVENLLCTLYRRGERRSTAEIMPFLERVGLAHAAHRPVGGFSTGMKKRLGIAQSLLFHPHLLILDEPTSGLDPNGVREMRSLIRELKSEGTSILLSSHILSEVEQIADRIGIINRGRVICEDTLAALTASPHTYRLKVDNLPSALALVHMNGLVGETEEQTLCVRLPDNKTIGDVVMMLVQHGISVYDVAPVRTRLEETFFQLLGLQESTGHDENAPTHAQETMGGQYVAC